MSETQEDIDNGNTKEAIEAQAQMNGVTNGDLDPGNKKEKSCNGKGTQGIEAEPKEGEEEEVGEGRERVGEREQESKEVDEKKERKVEKEAKRKDSGAFKLRLPKKEDIGRKSRRALLRLDIPSAQQQQQQIPVLSVIPATGSVGHHSPIYDDCSSSPTTSNSCVQCLVTAKLVWTLLSMVLDQITDAMAIERFFRMGHMLFFCLSLTFYVIPILILCTYSTKKLKRKLEWTWLDCALNFFISPYWLIFVNITNSVKNSRQQSRYEDGATDNSSLSEILKDEKALATLHTLEGSLEAIPQVYIQIAAYMTLPITSMYDEVVARLPLTMSVISVAWSVVGNLDVGTHNVFWAGVHRFFAASEVGVAMTTRAMVAGGLFLQLYPGIWQWVWLVPILLSILVTWFIMFFSVRSFKDLMMPLKKALALPPADLEGICGLMPFMVTSLCLLPSTYEPLLYFVGFEFLAGLSWFCFTLPKDGNIVLQ